MDRPEAGQKPATASDSGTPRPIRRPRASRNSRRFLRLAVLAAIALLVVLLLILGVSSCRQNRKADAYRSYLSEVGAVVTDSASLGKQLDEIVAKPSQYSRQELMAKVKELAAAQAAIADRAAALTAPEPLEAPQAVLADGMRIRARGYQALEKALLAALDNQTVSSASITALEGYFSGPDAYYMSLFCTQTQAAVSNEGVEGLTVPRSDYYLSANTLDSVNVQAMLDEISSSAKLVGRHGVALVRVTAQPEDIELATDLAATVTASTGLAFDVLVQNQGDVDEAAVPVKGQLVLPDGAVLTQTTTLTALPAGQQAKATLKGFAVPSAALDQLSTLQIEVGPVNGERVLTNNSGSFRMRLLPPQ